MPPIASLRAGCCYSRYRIRSLNVCRRLIPSQLSDISVKDNTQSAKRKAKKIWMKQGYEGTSKRVMVCSWLCPWSSLSDVCVGFSVVLRAREMFSIRSVRMHKTRQCDAMTTSRCTKHRYVSISIRALLKWMYCTHETYRYAKACSPLFMAQLVHIDVFAHVRLHMYIQTQNWTRRREP